MSHLILGFYNRVVRRVRATFYCIIRVSRRVPHLTIPFIYRVVRRVIGHSDSITRVSRRVACHLAFIIVWSDVSYLTLIL